MNNLYNQFKKHIKRIVLFLIIICLIFIVIGFVFFFQRHDGINKQEAMTGIIIPMICALIGACIPIAMDNSLTNEKLKISLNRLQWYRENFCADKYGKKIDGSKSIEFDTEYKFIYKNRGKNHEELLNLMLDDYFREKKYLKEKGDREITKNKFLREWIKDHFIY